jgi:hypothetical protein
MSDKASAGVPALGVKTKQQSEATEDKCESGRWSRTTKLPVSRFFSAARSIAFSSTGTVLQAAAAAAGVYTRSTSAFFYFQVFVGTRQMRFKRYAFFSIAAFCV